MPKLSRTQKFADLRDQITNDKESGISSADLNNYQDRFSNVQQTLNPNQNNYNDQQYDNSQYMWNNNQQSDYSNNSGGFDAYLNNNRQYNNYEVPDNPQNFFNDVRDLNEEAYSRKERDAYLNQTFDSVNAYNSNNGQLDINGIINNSVNEVRHPQNGFGGYDQRNVNSDFDWNQNNNYNNQPRQMNNQWGNQSQLDADMNYTRPQSDDEFSNTVSIEISKLMKEVSRGPQAAQQVAKLAKETEAQVQRIATDQGYQDNRYQQQPRYVEPEQPRYVEQEQPRFVEPEQPRFVEPEQPRFVEPEQPRYVEPEPVQPVVIEEPVYNNVPDNRDVVEIKNISETANVTNNTISSTIPFVVAADNEYDLDEEEEDGSNTVLNIILIVLIVVLIAVLGLIVFYILKTKGLF